MYAGESGEVDERVAQLLQPIADRPGASEAAIARLRQYVGADLPSDYVDFLRWRNGAAGLVVAEGVIGAVVGEEHSWLVLYPAEEIPELTDFGAPMHPGYLCIGSSGDSTFYVLLDIRSRNPQTMEFAQFDPYGFGPSGDEDGIEYRTTSFYELLKHLSTVFAHLPGADLRDVPLRAVHLYHADLSGADLSGADLAGADLRNANLQNAKLTGTNLAGTN